jgi:hypothetical protein
MSTLSTRPADTSASAGSRPRSRSRWTALTGAGFVVCALAGNGLAGGVDLTEPERPVAAQVGLGLEVVGVALLALYVAWVCSVAGRGIGRTTTAAAGAVMVAVKLGSGAALLAAWHEEDLDRASVEALVALNDAAFVLSWLPFGMLVAAAAVTLGELVGRALRTTGLLLGGLTVALGVAGAVAPEAAVPVPFLLSLGWLLVVSVRAAGTVSHRRGE